MNNKYMIEELRAIVNESNINIEEPMSKHTTFRIGGVADVFVTPSTKEELQGILEYCKTKQVPYYVIGNGSNLVVGDRGFRGVIIQIGNKLSNIEVVKKTETSYEITAGAGIMLSKLAMTAANESLTGLEFAAGIPGTLGGAVAMNAGAYGGEIKDCIQSAVVMDEQGNVYVLSEKQLELDYRRSIIQKKPLIVLEATFLLQIGEKEKILESIKTMNTSRKEKQPLEFPSAGSTFKRPEGYFAGKLVMDSGLRGYRVGNVAVSEKHCGFVVNLGGGTAQELMTLIQDVQRIVYEKYQVELEPEVRFIGEF